MENYINIDQNMVVNTTNEDVPIEWHDVRNAPFSIYGLYQPETEPFFHRLPMEVGEATSPGVDKLQRESAGGRIRFSTDSPYIAVRAKYRAVGRSSHLTLVSTTGYDLYIDGEFGSRYVREFRMPYDMVDSYEQVVELGAEVFRSYTLNMPVHACVESLEIGVKPGARLSEGRKYREFDPVVIYGSSIVHGTAASRPGNIYPSMISRMLNVDVQNLGFSGKAKGEQALAEYMATLPMSVFVCDYDHNAPTVEHLAATHYPLYETIRAKNPDLPYIMISRPNYWTCIRVQPEILKRRDVVMSSYLKARQAGDENVYFIDGMSFFHGANQYEYTMDAIHPNDAGFLCMAENIATVIRHILEKEA
ncbi:MAG: hypothetical protein IJA58_02235 [Lachnospiraceae bacterium]|nr:hypothetical protein [Lachnospiraceae bacterium]